MARNNPRVKRRQYLVHHGMQLSVVLSMVGVLTALSAVYVLSYFFLGNQGDLGPTSQSLARLGFLVSGLYFVMVLSVTLWVGIVSTQRIAGPALVIERAIRGMREGDFHRRLTLRKRDQLKSLAQEVTVLRDTLVEREAERRDFHQQMQEALERDDLEAALSLNRIMTEDPAPKVRTAPVVVPCQASSRETTPHPSPKGFSLLEIAVCLPIAIVGALGLLTSVTAASDLQEHTQQYGQASRLIRQVHDDFRNGDVDGRLAAFQGAPSFETEGVTVTVTFPEQALIDLLGTSVPSGWRYRDIDQDGEVELDAAAGASVGLLPVQITTRWENTEVGATFFIVNP